MPTAAGGLAVDALVTVCIARKGVQNIGHIAYLFSRSRRNHMPGQTHLGSHLRRWFIKFDAILLSVFNLSL